LVNEASLLAARKNKLEVGQTELLESIEKVLLGPERKSHILSTKEKEIVSYHEAGHALVAASLLNTDPVHKISIISRGMAGGYTLKLPTFDRRLHGYKYFLDELAVLLGGYTAEKTVFGELTTGASDDLMKASDLARKLVTDYGMSRLGPVTFDKPNDFRSSTQIGFSEKSAELIDREIKFLVDEAHKKAKSIISKKRKKLNFIAKQLIEKEVIEKAEFDLIMKRK
jgi:cell division protease FtsH